MRVADYIARSLADHGVDTVFMVTGGGAMHLNDAMGREKRLAAVCCHHEQACAMAAESYFRLSGRLAAVNVTTGPGGLNALNGVFGAWTDSLGVVVVSGQIKRETSIRYLGLALRQLGDQEVDILPIVAPITKFAAFLDDPQDCRYLIEKAIHIARSGRPGPVWIDVPIDVQAAPVDPARLRGFDPRELAPDRESQGLLRDADLDHAAGEILARLEKAHRPVVLPGAGVRIAGAAAEFLRFVEAGGIPVATAFNAHDLIWEDHPLAVGRPGTIGNRGGNFAVQNADLLLVLGCRLNIRQIGYNWQAFAPRAKIVMVDVDRNELAKPTLRVDLPVHADLAELLPRLTARVKPGLAAGFAGWAAWCKARHARYPVVLPVYREKQAPINPYCFMDALSDRLAPDAVVVSGDATACICAFQTLRLKRGQRLYSNSGSASMGYDLPAAIGAAKAALADKIGGGPARQVVCLAGDGSIMMNLQELATIAGQGLPIKIFLLNNGGYHSIRQTQKAYFPDSLIGFSPETGVSLPNWERLAYGFAIPYRRAARLQDLDSAIGETLAAAGPQLCEVMLDPEQPFAPRIASRRLDDGTMVSAPLEDMFPFLSREELAENMIGDGAG
jgi:acetolactate synthase-1/2/3 large subunit